MSDLTKVRSGDTPSFSGDPDDSLSIYSREVLVGDRL